VPTYLQSVDLDAVQASSDAPAALAG